MLGWRLSHHLQQQTQPSRNRLILFDHLQQIFAEPLKINRQVQGLIFETFDVSQERAQDLAAELVSLAEGWGSPEIAAQTDWPYRIRKDLGETRKLKWRSDVEREKFEAAQKK